MKINPEKCHLITSSSDEVSICVGNYSLKSSKYEKLLGIKIDNKLNFKNDNKVCKKTRQSLNMLPRVKLYMNLWKWVFYNRFLWQIWAD